MHRRDGGRAPVRRVQDVRHGLEGRRPGLPAALPAGEERVREGRLTADDFDLVVLGSGSAAQAVAIPCRAAGWRVAVAEHRPLGGTCALRGCDPKKVLVGAAEVVDRVRRMEGRGVAGRDVAIDWPALARFKRSFTDPVPAQVETRFRERGIEVLRGPARFTGPRSVAVGNQTVTARHVVIATGARPAPLAFPGADLLATSTDFLDLESLPPRVVFVGGGYVSFEFAHVAARAGARATILHRGARPLAGFDPDLVDRLAMHSRDVGIDVVLGTEVRGIERLRDAFVVRAGDRVVEADLVVHGAGRVPDLDDLDLEAAGVEREARGVRVDPHLRSVSNRAVYAAGDAAANGAPPLTPVAYADGELVAHNLLTGDTRATDYESVPSVVFTLPPLAAVGLSEETARTRGLDVRVRLEDTTDWYTARRTAERAAAYKTIVDASSGRILGAHLLGPHADEVINLFALAMRARLPAAELADALFAYPTASSDVGYMV